MDGYYDTSLAGDRLRRCYDLAPPRVRRYLDAEIEFALERLRGRGRALELGCGYGRVLGPVADAVGRAVGIDTSAESLRVARRELGNACLLAQMDAVALAFSDSTFDAVLCLQNGLSAFHADPRRVVGSALRVAAPGACLLFSSYSERFWSERLEWFRIQARHGLVGEIDEGASKAGAIVCVDGFTATTTGPDTFRALFAEHGIEPEVVEVDGSSLFCVATV